MFADAVRLSICASFSARCFSITLAMLGSSLIDAHALFLARLNNLSIIKDALERLLRSRLCASTPAQYGYIAGLKGDNEWMNKYLSMIKKNNDVCINKINTIKGLSVQEPKGAFYMFVRITHEYWKDKDLSLIHI